MSITVLTGLSEEAQIFSAVPGLTVLCGAAQRDALASLVPADCSALVSAGVAGALAPDLPVGALTVATSVIAVAGGLVPSRGNSTSTPATARWWDAVSRATGASTRPLFSDPRELCGTAAQRAALRATVGADVVDEESFAVAALALQLGVPFAVIRSISDTADEDLPPAEQDATNPDGSPDIMALVNDLLSHPGEIPGVARSGAEFEQALDTLRRAVQTLGPLLGLPA